MAERYSKQPVADQAAYQKKLQLTREYFRPEMEMMEIGCGTGTAAIAHAPYVRHILAVDISSKMIEIAQAKSRAENVTNVTFQRSTIHELDIADQTLDAVLALNILHLLDNKEEVVARVFRMLKHGGVFITSTICMGDTVRIAKFVAPIGKLFGLILKVFTASDLEHSLTDAGFEIDYRWQPDKRKPLFIVARKADQP